jgi:RNA polymerase sigma-70 factor (ECF subfamily)
MGAEIDIGREDAGAETLDGAAADLVMVEALRRGDEAAFTTLVDRYNAALQRLASTYVRDAFTAQEVVQETWIGLLESLSRFEGRSSLKTWLFRILTNCARARARKEAHTLPFSQAFPKDGHSAVSVEPHRFYPGWLPSIGGHWRRPPARWENEPEERALAEETRQVIQRSIDALPPLQREVIILRDVTGCPTDEVCNVLGLTDTNQRVLLHRARSSVRRALEGALEANP